MLRTAFLSTALLLLVIGGCSPRAASGPAPLRIGMELGTPPFEMANAAGEPDGISVRLAEELARKLGRPLQIEVMAFKGLETALKTGKIDLILSSMTDTPKRRQSMDFTDAYCRVGLALLVPRDSDVQSAADLNRAGRKVVARLGTTAVDYVKTNLPLAEVVLQDQLASCLLEISQHKADAFMYDQLSILKMHLSQPEATRTLLQPLEAGPWAMALAKGNDALLGQTNAFLKEFRAAGGFAKLADQYLKAEKAALAAQGVPFIME